MKKHENTTKENKNRKSGKRFQAGDSEGLFEMINRWCEGQGRTPDCCSGMKKMWEEMQDKSQEDRKQKYINFC